MLNSASLHCRFASIRPSLPQTGHNLLLPTSYTQFIKLRSPFNPNSPKFHKPHFTFPLLALKKGGNGGVAISQQSDSDGEFDEFFDEDDADFEDEDEDEDENEMLLPLKNAKEWLANRPRGFGEGKEYDTSIEDKLLQEVEQIKAAQAANINKLKNLSTSEYSSDRNVARIKGPEIVSTGVRVRIVNLPRKKNIHRDLMVAFKEFRGIISINPAVLGSKKTRDPICKGFAFVDCKSERDAISFVQAFSGQHLMFGRVQKQVKCEIMNRETSSSAHKISVESNHPRLNIIKEEAEQVTDMNLNLAPEVIRTRLEDIEENNASVDELHLYDEGGNGAESSSESNIQSPTLKELEKIHKVEKVLPQGREEVSKEISPIKAKTKVSKKKLPKEKGGKKSSTGVPGSAKRLRVKEKALLTDVYSRYGNKSALVSKEEN